MCCDSGSSSSPNNDPNVGKAAMMQAQTAQDALNFTQNYYNTVESPLIKQMTSASAQSQAEQQQLFNMNYSDMQLNDQMYRQYGIPAQQNYYNQVAQFSAPGYAEQQAQLALGDVTNSAAVQRAALNRDMASRGISANSGMALYNRNLNAMGTASSAAAAENQARNAAKMLGLQVSGDAANFGRGGASNVLGFGSAAGGNALSGYNIASGAMAAGNSGASVPMSGYSLANSAYGSQMSNYMQGAIANEQYQAQNSAGIGNFLGSVAGAAGQAGSFAALFSDRRLKDVIERIGTTKHGIPMYKYTFKADPQKRVHVGVMADEVEKVLPHAVSTHPNGYKMVDYGALQ